MHSTSLWYLILIIGSTSSQSTTTEFSLKQTSRRFGAPRHCQTARNEDGICVSRWTCNDQYEIERGGVIFDSETRSSNDCDDDEWCCTDKQINSRTSSVPETTESTTTSATTTTSTTPVTSGNSCFPSSDQNDCPWCVKLYRSGKDRFNVPSGFYCLGAMIGSKTILTTATCVRQAMNQVLWARVSSSTNPLANYTVISRMIHPKYNSGTRLYDTALLSTLSEVDWINGRYGACLDTDTFLGGDCMAANIDENENVIMAPVAITKGSCFSGGNVADAMCGHGLLLDTLLHGAPIICQKDNFYYIAGLTKTPYSHDFTKALLGNLDYDWLIASLKAMGLTETDYSFNLN